MGLFSRKKPKASGQMLLRGFPADPETNKCLLMAAEKGIVLQTELLDLSEGADQCAEYREVSPFGKVPFLKEDQFLVSGAQAILSYMDIRGQGPSLNPKKASILGEQNYWADIAQRFVDPATLRLVQPLFNNTDDSNTDAENASKEIDRVLAHLNNAFGDGRRFIVGEYSLADIHWTATLHLCLMAGKQELLDKHTAVKAWFDRAKAHTNRVNRKTTYPHLAGLEAIRNKQLPTPA